MGAILYLVVIAVHRTIARLRNGNTFGTLQIRCARLTPRTCNLDVFTPMQGTHQSRTCYIQTSNHPRRQQHRSRAP